jgi:hypothetical protein
MMSKFDKSGGEATFEKLMRGKFGVLYDWKKPTIEKTVGPYLPDNFESFNELLKHILTKCEDVLRGASPENLETLSANRKHEESVFQADWRRVYANDIKTLGRQYPHWAACGFGHPDYIADFEYWARMPNLYLYEAVSLSVGVEPKHLKELLDEPEDVLEEIANPLAFAWRRSEQFKRKFHIYRPQAKINSTELLTWIMAVDLEVHDKTLEALNRFHGETDAAMPMSKRPDKRELDSVAALFTAMAIEQFGYVPSAKRSPTVKEIQDLAASLGISMSDDMIRHYLRHGAKFIDPDWEPNSR